MAVTAKTVFVAALITLIIGVAVGYIIGYDLGWESAVANVERTL